MSAIAKPVSNVPAKIIPETIPRNVFVFIHFPDALFLLRNETRFVLVLVASEEKISQSSLSKLANLLHTGHNFRELICFCGEDMPHFFISYAKKDTRELAISLSAALNALPNVTAWVDRSLKAGASWELQIQSEIDKCDYFVVLYSPDLNRHKQGEEPSYVLKEISYTLYTAKKPIIPVMAQKTQAPFSLNDAHYIDYTISGLKLDDLLDAICDEAGIQLQNNAPVGTVSIPSAAKPIPNPSVKDLLPPPFDWCKIPTGKVILSNLTAIKETYISKGYGSKTFDIPAFLMAKYPITNAQYRLFISAGGYQDTVWWTEEGWQWTIQNAVIKPSSIDTRKWNHPEYPVSVEWYEAVAFCHWLSAITGEKIILPTEQQWQRAAQGDDRRAYPWGNDFDMNKANTRESNSDTLTPVTKYSNGASPYGVMDMIGNEREWCLTEYYTGSNDLDDKKAKPQNESYATRVQRGGMFFFNAEQVNYRKYQRQYGYNGGGFRIARNLD
jgi:hypothetical protein